MLLLLWLNPPQMLPHRTFSCWADLPMSGLETTSCNFPSTCASAHTVSRTLWSWSGCCWLWLEQKWLPSCRDLKMLPHWTEDIDFCTCSCIAIHSKPFDYSILWFCCQLFQTLFFLENLFLNSAWLFSRSTNVSWTNWTDRWIIPHISWECLLTQSFVVVL